MAGPNRPTKRERKDEAKKRRLEEMRRRQRRARMRKVYTYATVAAVIAAIVGVVMFNRASNANKREEARKLAATAGCDAPKAFPIEGRDHVQPPQTINYKTDPPTSGAHYSAQQPPSPTATGVHANTIQDESAVHNLEHGHLIASYKPDAVDKDVLAELEKVVKDNPQWAILAPRPKNRVPLAFTGWGIKQSCEDPNRNAGKVFAEFVKRFRNGGPESVPGQPVFQTQFASPSPAASPSPGGSPGGSPGSSPRTSPGATGSPAPNPTTTGSAAPATPS